MIAAAMGFIASGEWAAGAVQAIYSADWVLAAAGAGVSALALVAYRSHTQAYQPLATTVPV
jgi:hypothetical protein